MSKQTTNEQDAVKNAQTAKNEAINFYKSVNPMLKLECEHFEYLARIEIAKANIEHAKASYLEGIQKQAYLEGTDKKPKGLGEEPVEQPENKETLSEEHKDE